jgi:hypothetical protein
MALQEQMQRCVCRLATQQDCQGSRFGFLDPTCSPDPGQASLQLAQQADPALAGLRTASLALYPFGTDPTGLR